jgi:hypothetical protein
MLGSRSPRTLKPRRRNRGFDFEAKRRHEIILHARFIGAAETEDFDRPLIAWLWHTKNVEDPIWSLQEAARRMGGDISEAEASEIAAQAATYPKRIKADALGAWLGITYRQRTILRITTIGACDVKKRARKELRKRKDRRYQARKRREHGARPHAESLSQTAPWGAMGISRRTWERRRAATIDANSSAALFVYLSDESATATKKEAAALRSAASGLAARKRCAFPSGGQPDCSRRSDAMTPEQTKNGAWFVILPDGHRLEFDSNASAWRWIDRFERRELWVGSHRQWRHSPIYALPLKST